MLVGMGCQEASEAAFVEADTVRTYVEVGIGLVDRQTVTAEENAQEPVIGTGTDQVALHLAWSLLELLRASDEAVEPAEEQSDQQSTVTDRAQAVEKAANGEMDENKEPAAIHTGNQTAAHMEVMVEVAAVVAGVATVTEDTKTEQEIRVLLGRFVKRRSCPSDSLGFL